MCMAFSTAVDPVILLINREISPDKNSLSLIYNSLSFLVRNYNTPPPFPILYFWSGLVFLPYKPEAHVNKESCLQIEKIEQERSEWVNSYYFYLI